MQEFKKGIIGKMGELKDNGKIEKYDQIKKEILSRFGIEEKECAIFFELLMIPHNMEQFELIENGNTVEYYNFKAKLPEEAMDDLLKENDKLRHEIYDLNIATRRVSEYLGYYMNDDKAVYDSFSYKFGHVVTRAPRWFYRKLKKRDEIINEKDFDSDYTDI